VSDTHLIMIPASDVSHFYPPNNEITNLDVVDTTNATSASLADPGLFVGTVPSTPN
jgi:hypothetical protein